MKRKNRTKSNRVIRHERIRKVVFGTSEKPRLCVFRSSNHLEAQFIDDLEQKTLIGFSTKSKKYQEQAKTKKAGRNTTAAKDFGKFIAEAAKQKGLKNVVFDRGGYLYHGRVKAFAEAARENGLAF